MLGTPETVTIRKAAFGDTAAWSKHRASLWPQLSAPEHLLDIEADLRDPSKICLLALQSDDVVGFIELGLRSVVDGCDSSPVAYIEGWYVTPTARGQGIGRKLVEAGEVW